MSEQRMIAMRRIKKELERIKKNPPVEVMVGPKDDNLFLWEGMLNGPEDSPYAGGIFKFRIEFCDEYPMRAPHVWFTTKVYHPNISEKNGEICVTILKDQWSSVLTVSDIMISISSLLTDPNPNSPLNPESGNLYVNDRKAYNKKVREYVRKYASAESLQ